MSEAISVAIVGFGGSGSGIHAPLLASHQRFTLDAIVTQDPTRIKEAARRYPQAVVSSRFEAAAGCDVAVVTLPPPFRGTVVERLLATGAHVVVEKPLGWELAEAERLAARGDGRVTVFHNRRWDSDFLTLQRLRADGAWSPPVRLESRIGWWMPSARAGWRNRVPGGGILTEVGTHLIDQAVRLLGPAKSVYAELDRRRAGAAAEDDVFVALRHADGSVAHLSAGPTGDAGLPRFELATDQVRITLGEPDPQQQQLAREMKQTAQNWGIPDSSTWTIVRGSDDRIGVHPERGWWPGFYDEVARWVEGGDPPISLDDAIAVSRIIEAARESARDSSVVSLTGGR